MFINLSINVDTYEKGYKVGIYNFWHWKPRSLNVAWSFYCWSWLCFSLYIDKKGANE